MQFKHNLCGFTVHFRDLNYFREQEASSKSSLQQDFLQKFFLKNQPVAQP